MVCNKLFLYTKREHSHTTTFQQQLASFFFTIPFPTENTQKPSKKQQNNNSQKKIYVDAGLTVFSAR